MIATWSGGKPELVRHLRSREHLLRRGSARRAGGRRASRACRLGTRAVVHSVVGSDVRDAQVGSCSASHRPEDRAWRSAPACVAGADPERDGCRERRECQEDADDRARIGAARPAEGASTVSVATAMFGVSALLGRVTGLARPARVAPQARLSPSFRTRPVPVNTFGASARKLDMQRGGERLDMRRVCSVGRHAKRHARRHRLRNGDHAPITNVTSHR